MKISLSAVLAATLLLASCSGNDNGFTISKGSTLKVSVEQEGSAWWDVFTLLESC